MWKKTTCRRRCLKVAGLVGERNLIDEEIIFLWTCKLSWYLNRLHGLRCSVLQYWKIKRAPPWWAIDSFADSYRFWGGSNILPITSSTTPASRMRVVCRAPGVSRACRTFFTNSLPWPHEQFWGLRKWPCSQLCITRNVRALNRDRVGNPYRRLSSRGQSPDTIYALSTPTGRAAIAVVRISGPACLDVRLSHLMTTHPD